MLSRVTETRRERWEQAAEWPLTAASLIFLAAYAWPILQPGLDDTWRSLLDAVTWAAWALFAVDYVVRLSLSVDRRRFVRGHLLDLAVVVLPLLRPLRLLRLLTVLSVLSRYAGSALRGRVLTYVGGATALAMFIASLALLDAERAAPDANVTSFGDALWWAFTTVTTVGYGDQYPVTVTGRAIAVGLMLVGIVLLGTVTASVASWLIEKIQQIEEESKAVTRRDIAALAEEVAALRRELSRDT
jgi:voltage-gated potassium channel